VDDKVTSSATPTNMLQEAQDLQKSLSGDGIPTKLIGGIAIAMRCPHIRERGLERDYHDIDACALARDAKKIESVMTRLGFDTHKHFNAMNYGRQMMFTNSTSGVHVDIFLDVLRMCQELKFTDRLAVDEHCSLAASDLALSKLQIVELADKDKTDLLALLLDHEPSPGSESGLNISRIAEVCQVNWGWWKSAIVTLDATKAYAPARLSPRDLASALAHIEVLRTAIVEAPKSARWKARARVGERMKWYELPEETQPV